MKRRDVIKLLGTGLASVYLGGWTSVTKGQRTIASPESIDISSFGPFDRSLGAVAPAVFSGDLHPENIHKVLWNKEEFLKSIHFNPSPTETADVVIVGGGISGLLSAYFLKNHNPIILEQAPRFGGNSRGESWQGIDYSIATAYTDVPKVGSPIHQFFSDLRISQKFKIHSDSDPIFIDNVKYEDIWTKGTLPESKKQFVKLAQHFNEMASNTNGLKYPVLPPVTKGNRRYVNKLDALSFYDYILKFLNEPLHPHVEHVLENYFWSAAACSSREMSAAAGLNFFVGDFNEVAVFPGGNGAIAEATLKSILNVMPVDRLRPSSLVFDVRVQGDGVNVSYLNKDNKPVTIRAKTVIMSCPKFVAAKLIDSLEPHRLSVIKKQKYRSYIVANVLIQKPMKSYFYDLFVFDQNEMKIEDTEKAARQQRATDMVYGNYGENTDKNTVLTLFRGLPYDRAREEIYHPEYYGKIKSEFEDQIYGKILPLFDFKRDDVVDIRLTRWGHPLPVFQVGNLKNKYVDALRKPFRKRVFFVEQDNWTLPSFETAFSEARYWTTHVAGLLTESRHDV